MIEEMRHKRVSELSGEPGSVITQVISSAVLLGNVQSRHGCRTKEGTTKGPCSAQTGCEQVHFRTTERRQSNPDTAPQPFGKNH